MHLSHTGFTKYVLRVFREAGVSTVDMDKYESDMHFLHSKGYTTEVAVQKLKKIIDFKKRQLDLVEQLEAKS
jgi:hypothetical protein